MNRLGYVIRPRNRYLMTSWERRFLMDLLKINLTYVNREIVAKSHNFFFNILIYILYVS